MLYLPITIKLFDQIWHIRAAEPRELGQDLGECRSDQLEIVISADQGTDVQVHTLMHELIHAIEIKLELELTERQVDVMALGLIHMFRSNPQLLEFILGDPNAKNS